MVVDVYWMKIVLISHLKMLVYMIIKIENVFGIIIHVNKKYVQMHQMYTVHMNNVKHIQRIVQ